MPQRWNKAPSNTLILKMFIPPFLETTEILQRKLHCCTFGERKLKSYKKSDVLTTVSDLQEALLKTSEHVRNEDK